MLTFWLSYYFLKNIKKNIYIYIVVPVRQLAILINTDFIIALVLYFQVCELNLWHCLPVDVI